MKGFQHFLQTFRCVSSSRRIERFRNVHKYYVNTVAFEVRVFIPSRPLSYQYLINPVTGSDYSPQSLRTPGARVLSFTPPRQQPFLGALVFVLTGLPKTRGLLSLLNLRHWSRLLPWPHIGCSLTHTAHISPKLVCCFLFYSQYPESYTLIFCR